MIISLLVDNVPSRVHRAHGFCFAMHPRLMILFCILGVMGWNRVSIRNAQ